METKTRIFILAVAIIAIIISIMLIEQKKPERVVFEDSNVGLTVGKIAPNFELEDIFGEKIQLNDFRGKAILLNFWASWCAPCRTEMPEFQKIYEINQDEIVIVGVNLQENKVNIEKFVEKLDISFPILLDPDSKVKSLYNIFTQPVTYFIDKDGKIIDKKFGPLTIEEINKKTSKVIKKKIQITQSDEDIKTLPDGTKYIVDPKKIVSGGVSKDGIPSIDNPKFVSVEEADEWIQDNELVLAIVYKGIKRVYPLQIMVWHEIVNDNIANDPILITYCPLCSSGIAYERRIDGKEVEFGTSGKLYNSNLVMYDRKTDTYWSQIGGLAIVGELTGTRLNPVSIDTVVWRDWKKAHLDSEVLSQDTGFRRDYGRDPYGSYYEDSSLIFSVENRDDRIHPKTIIFGIEVNGLYKAYKEDDLKEFKIIEDTVDGVKIKIERDDVGIVKITNLNTGKEIVKERDFWFAWYAFHPETGLYEQ